MHNHDITRITKFSWGRMEVAAGGGFHQFKDCKVWPGGAKAWDWRLTGTRHKPGIQANDIEEILDQGVEIIVMSRGMLSMLHICHETEELLQSRGIVYHIEETRKAIKQFNELSEQGAKVGGIFHSTC